MEAGNRRPSGYSSARYSGGVYTSLYLSGTCSLPGSEKGRSVSSCKVTSNGGFSFLSTLAALRSELTRGVSIFWVSSGKSGVAALRSALVRGG